MNERDVKIRSKVLDDILDERARQDRKWGVQNHHPAVWMAILGEEVGEAVDTMDRPECEHGNALQKLVLAGEDCKAICENPKAWIRPMLPGRGLENYRAELVQVAAVALSAIECLDRNAGKE